MLLHIPSFGLEVIQAHCWVTAFLNFKKIELEKKASNIDTDSNLFWKNIFYLRT